ncbi:4179_t:CDS:2 [Entrophospora sp. SA101]|nr:4179_t:CDS:2 [Entrophospora sp. SA101]
MISSNSIWINTLAETTSKQVLERIQNPPELDIYSNASSANPSKFEKVADAIFNWKPQNEEGFPDEADIGLKTIHASISADLTLVESIKVSI